MRAGARNLKPAWLTQMKAALDGLMESHGVSYLHTDPLRFPHRYPERDDREAVALISALFAYGNVVAMGGFLEGLLGGLGKHPARSLRGGNLGSVRSGYRFQTAGDVCSLLAGLGRVLNGYGRFEEFFELATGDVEERLEAFAKGLRASCGKLTPGLAHLMPLPSAGSACKRWWMFLRWVCRPADGLDLGLWNCVSPSDLRLPVDTHVARIGHAIGLTRRLSADAAFAKEATETLALLCPEDPVRYDFAIARLGIIKACKGRKAEKLCTVCPLKGLCALGE